MILRNTGSDNRSQTIAADHTQEQLSIPFLTIVFDIVEKVMTGNQTSLLVNLGTAPAAIAVSTTVSGSKPCRSRR
ncbi:MAG TPA: hypothetical protein VGK01_11545 [Candidatus Angelobacter sp.]|jgi:hypothetical protein